MNRNFPRYLDFNPKVPVWCVTPDHPGCIHRFFDTSPISPSGRYLAAFQLPIEDRLPDPGELGKICIVDLESGETNFIAETCGWGAQMGANINWGASDHELFFNDVDTNIWHPFAWKINPLTGKRYKMEGTVYHVSPDGRWLLSANLTTMTKTQVGYSVCLPNNGTVKRNIGPSKTDGFYLTDTATGKKHLLVNIADLLADFSHSWGISDFDQQEIYGFHCKFNPQGDKVMLSLRWFPVSDNPNDNMFHANFSAIRFAWITMSLDGKEKHCAVGPDQWEKGGHHATWFPDGRRISMNLNIDRDGMRFVAVNADGSNLHTMLPDAIGTGHPTVHADGRHLMTDTYTWGATSFGDGTIPLRWIDLENGEEEVIVRM
ncbi:TolB family protein [Candidatus Electrothrix sp.]|uniref:TolB family protein n=1 Tax=Candidatus Electrothrix sp. TaxID=2170559 RepID=UPI004055EE4E